MKIVKWAAVIVTALFVLMNLGVAFDPDQDDWVRVVGGVLAAVGIPALIGLATAQDWGRPAVVAVGLLNAAGGVAALVDDQEGAVIGIVVGGLGALLGFLSGREAMERTPSTV